LISRYLCILFLSVVSLSSFGEDFSYSSISDGDYSNEISKVKRVLTTYGFMDFIKSDKTSGTENQPDQVFFDPFLYEFVHIKYGLSGKFSSKKYYKTNMGLLFHIRDSKNTYTAIHFSGISKDKSLEIARKIRSSLEHYSILNNVWIINNLLIPKAHAVACLGVDKFLDVKGGAFSQIDSIARKGMGSRLLNCMAIAGQEVGNDLRDIWDETRSIIEEPRKFWNETVHTTRQLAVGASVFANAMFNDPLGEISDKIGGAKDTLTEFFQVIQNLPPDQRWELGCQFLGDAGLTIAGMYAGGLASVKLAKLAHKYLSIVKNGYSLAKIKLLKKFKDIKAVKSITDTAFKTKDGITVLFNADKAVEHFSKHSKQIMKYLRKDSYNLKEYMLDANNIIKSGQFVPELNGYVKLIGSAGNRGKAHVAFVGLKQDGKSIATFHMKSVSEIMRKAPSLGWKP
jgi:hypothetical protein